MYTKIIKWKFFEVLKHTNYFKDGAENNESKKLRIVAKVVFKNKPKISLDK